jgi:hypothetical protein
MIGILLRSMVIATANISTIPNTGLPGGDVDADERHADAQDRRRARWSGGSGGRSMG